MRKLLFALYLLAFAGSVTANAKPNEEPDDLVLLADRSDELMILHEVLPTTKLDNPEWKYTKQIEIEPIKEAEPEEPELVYYGNCRITFYDSCPQCTGQWYGINATASGSPPVAWWTVANGALPFGTRVLIDGNEYEVMDRGVGAESFDIYVNSHSEIPPEGVLYREVYIING